MNVPQACPGSGQLPASLEDYNDDWWRLPDGQRRCTGCHLPYRLRTDGNVRRHDAPIATTEEDYG